MLGDELEISWGDFRHSWRRHRPRVPSPRKRTRPEPLRLFHARHGPPVDAQWISPGRRPQDVEERGQFHHHPRALERLAGRGLAISNAHKALPTADRLDGNK